MLKRQLTKWKAQILREDDQAIVEVDAVSYWDPTREGIPDAIAESAAAIVSAETQRRHRGVTAVQV